MRLLSLSSLSLAIHLLMISALLKYPCLASPPAIGVIPDQVIQVNGHTPALSFTVNLANYTLKGSSSDPLLFPATNIVFGGSASKPTVTITAAPNRFGQASITLEADGNSGGSITTFLVTVNAQLQIHRLGDQVMLSWSATNAVVQMANQLQGGWSDIFPTVTSPYAVPRGTSQFFQLRQE
jgi:hypothetical protein